MDQTNTPPADPDLDSFLGVEGMHRGRRIARRTAIVVGIVLVLLLVVRCVSGAHERPRYATVPARQGDLAVSVSATGNLAPTKQINVGSEESGLVVDVFVQNNDHVAKGQPLARLDTSRLKDALAQSQAQLLAAQATVLQNQATVDQTGATLRRYREVARLSGGKVPSATELDTARGDAERGRRQPPIGRGAGRAGARGGVDQPDQPLQGDDLFAGQRRRAVAAGRARADRGGAVQRRDAVHDRRRPHPA